MSTYVLSQQLKDNNWQGWKDYKLDENVTVQISSEIKISVIIEERYLELAVRCLHTAFGLDAEPTESRVRG